VSTKCASPSSFPSSSGERLAPEQDPHVGLELDQLRRERRVEHVLAHRPPGGEIATRRDRDERVRQRGRGAMRRLVRECGGELALRRIAQEVRLDLERPFGDARLERHGAARVEREHHATQQELSERVVRSLGNQRVRLEARQRRGVREREPEVPGVVARTSLPEALLLGETAALADALAQPIEGVEIGGDRHQRTDHAEVRAAVERQQQRRAIVARGAAVSSSAPRARAHSGARGPRRARTSPATTAASADPG
jgi:hypothetical protein